MFWLPKVRRTEELKRYGSRYCHNECCGLHFSIIHQLLEVVMVSIVSLWLPILLSSVFVFILSSLVHMVFGYHANDNLKLPDEDAFADALRKFNIPPGSYVLPRASSMKDMGSPEYQEKVKKGPGALLTIWRGASPSMAPYLLQWFVYSVLIGILAAYVAGRRPQPLSGIQGSKERPGRQPLSQARVYSFD